MTRSARCWQTARRAWAHERVRDTTRPWCVFVTSVVLNRMRLPVPGGELPSEAAPSGYAIIDGEAMCTDEWARQARGGGRRQGPRGPVSPSPAGLVWYAAEPAADQPGTVWEDG